MRGQYSVLVDMRKDYTGNKIGHLSILSFIKREKNDTYWNALCDCGKVTIIKGGALRRNKNKSSCGCQRPIYSNRINTDPKEANITRYLGRYTGRCKKDAIKWQLSRQQFVTFIFNKCYYCGIEPNYAVNLYNRAQFNDVKSIASKRRHEESVIFVNGIDRMDCNLDYSLDNCVTCCQDCNYGKYTKTPEQFRAWINRVWNYQNNKEIS